jgi:hypothetical protein
MKPLVLFMGIFNLPLTSQFVSYHLNLKKYLKIIPNSNVIF